MNDKAGEHRIANKNEKHSEPRKDESDTNCSARGRESNPDVRSHTRGRANSVRGRAEDPVTQEHQWFTSSKCNPPLTRRWGYHPLSALTDPKGPHTRKRKSHLYDFSFSRRIFLGHDTFALMDLWVHFFKNYYIRLKLS